MRSKRPKPDRWMNANSAAIPLAAYARAAGAPDWETAMRIVDTVCDRLDPTTPRNVDTTGTLLAAIEAELRNA